MKWPHKEAEGKSRHSSAVSAMFPLSLLFSALLATSTAQSGLPEYVRDQWAIGPDETSQYETSLYEDPDGQTLPADDSVWPAIPPEVVGLVTVEDHRTTPEPLSDTKEQPDSDAVDDSYVWKIVLVVAVLLVSSVGSLSLAYYLCVWRGGRIYYQPQKQTGA